MGIKESIDDTRKGFEESFATGDFYNRQTQDSDHLEKILGFVKISKGMKILDLGCGSGDLTPTSRKRESMITDALLAKSHLSDKCIAC